MMEYQHLCKFCSKEEAKYVCPRCNIAYCSLPCYQSQEHIQCSESFYKDCIEEQIKNDDLDPQSQKKMMEILQRVHNIDEQFHEEDMQDSDDESDKEELAARLLGVDLNDADSVWQKLTLEEKGQFEELLKSGDVSQVVPQWQPWWFYRETKKLVMDLDGDDDQNSEETQLASSCPPVKEDIQSLSELLKVVPSPSVRWNVINVLASYAFTARVYNGEHLTSPVEASATLLSLSGNLSVNQQFDSPEMAVTAVYMANVDSNLMDAVLDVFSVHSFNSTQSTTCVGGGGGNDTQLKDDVERLVEGPSETKKSHYLLAALSDTHLLLTSAKRKIKETVNIKSKGEFTKRFQDSNNSASSISLLLLNKGLKKIEFYLSWVKECF